MKSTQEDTNKAGSGSTGLAAKVKDYVQLIKFTLSFMVVFSTVVCYLLAPGIRFDMVQVLLLFAGGMLITGSANAINMILEKRSDSLMKRTAGRPVASGRMSVNEATAFAVIAGALGVFIMWYHFNMASALIGLASLFLYGFIYTPLKTRNSVAVLVGAFPGALPCLIGWVAGFYDQPIMWTGGLILFAIQFLWQFPHFWAIAWVAHRDYTAAGFKLLPSEKGPTKFTALQTVMYSALMIPVGVLPHLVGINPAADGSLLPMSGQVSMWIILGCNLWMVYVSVMLYLKMDVARARWVMFSSYFYLMIVLLSLYANKI